MIFIVDAGRRAMSPLKFKIGVGPAASRRTTNMPVLGCADVHWVMALVNWAGIAAAAVPADRAAAASVTDLRKRLVRREFTTAATIAGRREIPPVDVVCGGEASPRARLRR
jgi:hypothetical protein